jgi:hypothetical protein
MRRPQLNSGRHPGLAFSDESHVTRGRIIREPRGIGPASLAAVRGSRAAPARQAAASVTGASVAATLAIPWTTARREDRRR